LQQQPATESWQNFPLASFPPAGYTSANLILVSSFPSDMPHDPFLNQSQDSGGPQMPSLKEGQWLFNRRYELVRKLGAGGMGVVWLARDHTEETQVALKFLPAVLVQHEAEMKRLKEEVRAGKELRHPGIVATYALELEGSTAAIVMEYVEGKTLAELLEAQARGFFEPQEITGWTRDIADAVDYLHRDAKRIHRDLKPANILVDAAGRARLMDFGISRRVQESVTRHSRSSVVPPLGGSESEPAEAGTTKPDSSATLAYASPQQLAGKPAHPADDLYSLGALLYELLTGTPPFFRGDAALVAVQIKTEPVTPLLERRAELVSEGLNASTGEHMPPALEKAVLSCLEKAWDKRPASASDVIQSCSPPEAVKSLSTPETYRTPRQLKIWVLFAAPLVAAAAFGTWAMFLQPREVIKEVPKLVEDTASKEEAARQKQRADDLEKRHQEEERKRLAAEAEAKKAKEDAEAAKKAAMPPNPFEMHATSAPESPPAAPRGQNKPLSATKEMPFTNSLGMKFVPAVDYKTNEGKTTEKVLFSIWETRSRDYAAFVEDSGHDAGEDWRTFAYGDLPVGRDKGETAEQSSHPVAHVSHDDAAAFCAWLTKKERASGQIGSQDEYRLPTDVEWSYAVGIGEPEDASASPKDKHSQIEEEYPWGTTWPPPTDSGNYADTTSKAEFGGDWSIIEGYTDGYVTTAPVGSFTANALGLYDMGGNLWEWTGTPYEPGKEDYAMRGASWYEDKSSCTLSSHRHSKDTGLRDVMIGFRCVLVVSGG
jgi:serine/threonine protein kinase